MSEPTCSWENPGFEAWWSNHDGDAVLAHEAFDAGAAEGYDDGYKAGLADGSSVAEEVMRDCETRGAARAVEQCRRLAEEAAAEAPNGWMREALEGFAASLPATAFLPTTAGKQVCAAELREKIATAMKGEAASRETDRGDDFWLRSSEGPKLMRDLAARIRAGEFG